MLELTEFQQRELSESGESPPSVFDPATNTRYVLLRTEAFDRFRALIDDDLDVRQVSQLVEAAMREDDVGDPTVGYYQQEHGRRK